MRTGGVTIPDLVLCFVGFFMPHVPLSSLFSSFGLPSVSLGLSALFPLDLLICAPPLHYLTWPPPSSLSSPVPRWLISVCVFSLCVSCTPCMSSVWFCLPLLMPLLLSVPCSFWYVFLDFEFCILILTLVLICTLPFFLCTLFRCSVATLFFCPHFVCFGFCIQKPSDPLQLQFKKKKKKKKKGAIFQSCFFFYIV